MLAIAQIPSEDPAGNPVRCDLRGKVDSGSYSFEVPAGLSACRIWPRMVTIPLGDRNEDRTIHVGYSPNALFHGSFAELRAFYCNEETEPVECADATVHGRSVVRVLTRPTTPAPRVVESVATLGRETNAKGSIMYEYFVTMVTDEDHLGSDRAVLEAVLQTWRIE